jgi:hypothetical protein
MHFKHQSFSMRSACENAENGIIPEKAGQEAR